MVKPIPGTSLYISDTGDILYYDGQVCRLPEKDNIIEIEICGTLRRVDRQFLILYALFEIPTFVRFEDVYFIPMNVPRKLVPWKAMFKHPYYLDKDNEYRIVPSFSTIAVSKDGRVITTNTRKVLNPCPGKTGYLYIDVYNPTICDWRHIGLHHVVAHAWNMKDQDEFHYVVNHINGNRLDNHSNNLEWVTPAYNTRDGIKRKYENSKEIVGRVRNVKTGEITEFNKLKDMYDFIGISHVPSTHFKGMRRKDLINNLYEVRIGNDKRPWYYDADEVIGKKSSRYIISVTEPNGKVLLFNGVVALREYYNLDGGKRSVHEMCEILRKKFPGFTIDYIDRTLSSMEIEVMTVSTNNVVKFKTAFDVARDLHLEFKRVRALIASNGHLSYKGYRMRIASENSWCEDVREVRPQAYKVKITNKSTNKTTIHPSITSAATEMCVESRTVSRMIASPNIYDKYTVEILDEES